MTRSTPPTPSTESVPPGPAVSAIVLAGGRSRRFGSDKRRAEVDGEPLVARAIHAVAAVADEVVLVLAPGETPGPLLAGGQPFGADLVVAHDPVAHEGPLAGLAAGLAGARGEIVIVVAGDMPTLHPGVLRLLLARAADPATPGPWTLAVPPENPPAVFPLAARADALRAAVDALRGAGELRPRALLDPTVAPTARTVPAAEWRTLDPAGATLRDIDTPEDVARS